tara:strand:+ start:49 stop:621 length:573 start_codon:yes stop_codon:yes gene_type:complete
MDKRYSFLLGIAVTSLSVMIALPYIMKPTVHTKETIQYIEIPIEYERHNYAQQASEIKSTLNQSKLKHLLIYIDGLCKEYNVSYDIVKAVIATESDWRHEVVSTSGAIGLMQILPSTASSEFDTPKDQLYDPYVNVTVGIMYLSELQNMFDGDLYAILTAYSHGPTATFTYSQNYILTNSYVQSVLRENS